MQHPLEPLTPSEIQQTVELLHKAGHLTSRTRVISMSLLEPPKEWVYRFSQGDPIVRQAFAVLFDNSRNACYEATVCLDTQRVVTHTHIPGVQPTMSMDEQMECEQAVLQSEEFQTALNRNYGIDDPSLVMVDIWSAGNYGSDEDRTRRLGSDPFFGLRLLKSGRRPMFIAKLSKLCRQRLNVIDGCPRILTGDSARRTRPSLK